MATLYLAYIIIIVSSKKSPKTNIMKKLLTFSASCVIALILFTAQVSMSSCTKDTVTTDTVTKIVNDTTKILQTIAPTETSLLVEKQWEFDSVYSNYTGPGTGTLVYVRGASNNSIDFDTFWDEFWPDGTVEVFNENGSGEFADFTWGFSPTDTTLIIYPPFPPSRPNYSYTRLLSIDSTHINYYDSTGVARYWLIPKP
jgi:hypothetical protein